MTQVLSKPLRATDQDIDDYLMHYGVKGMKWGVRKDDRGKVKSVLKRDFKAKEDTEFDAIREVSKPVDKSIGRFKKIYKNANPNIKKSIRNINQIPEYKDADLTNPKNKLTKKYHSEINQAVTKQLNSSSVLVNRNVKQGFIPIFEYDTSRGNRVKGMHQIAPGNPLTSKDAKDLALASQRGVLNTKDRVLRTTHKAAIASSIAANSFGVGSVNALGVGVAAAVAYTNHGPSRSTADMFVPKGLESLANDAGVSARSPLGIKLFGGNANDVEIMKRKRMQHAAGSDYDILVSLLYKIDNNGKVYDFEADVMASKDDIQHNEMNDIDGYLMHYGVKGMRWGVRKDRNKSGSKKSSKKSGSGRTTNIDNMKDGVVSSTLKGLQDRPFSESELEAAEDMKDVFDKSRAGLTRELKGVNKRREFSKVDVSDHESETTKEYLRHVENAVDKHLNLTSQAIAGNHRELRSTFKYGHIQGMPYLATGFVRNVAFVNPDVGMQKQDKPAYDKYFNDIEKQRKRSMYQSALEHSKKIYVYHKPTLDSSGKITGFTKMDPPSMKHSDLLSVKMKDIASGNHLAHYQASMELDGYLMHYGVKGMKWGVRKDLKKKNVYERSEYIAKKDAKWRSNVSNPKKAIRVAKRASREATRMTKELNAKYKKQGYKIGGNPMRKKSLDNRRNKLARAQYDTELKGILEYSLDKAALKVYKNSPTRLYQVNLSRNSDGTLKAKVAPRQNAKLDKQRAAITKRNMRIKHSDEDDVVDLNGLEFDLTQDSDGYVTSVGVPGDDLEHDELNDLDLDDYLMHYGVKGMKWGVRKDGKPQGYQGGGGSSKSKKKKKSDTVNRVKSNLRKTAGNAKKKVSKISEANKDRKEARAKAKAAAKAKPKPKAKRELDVDKAQSEARAIEAERKSNPTLHSPDTTKTILTNSSRTGSMTDAELKATIQRMHLENTYAKLVREATPKSTSQKLKEFAKATATDIAKQQVKRVAGDFVGNLVDQAVSGGVKDAKDQKKKKESKPDTPKSDSKPKTDTPKSESNPKTEAPKSTPTAAPDSKTKPVAPTWRPTPPGPGRPPNKPPAPTWRPTPSEQPLSGAPIFGDRGRNYKGTRRARDVIDNNASVTVAELMERRKRRQG